MGTKLNKQAYTKLIDENIAEINKYMPEFSLEKRHSIDVLKWSIKALYDDVDQTSHLESRIVELEKYCDELEDNLGRHLLEKVEMEKEKADNEKRIELLRKDVDCLESDKTELIESLNSIIGLSNTNEGAKDCKIIAYHTLNKIKNK